MHVGPQRRLRHRRWPVACVQPMMAAAWHRGQRLPQISMSSLKARIGMLVLSIAMGPRDGCAQQGLPQLDPVLAEAAGVNAAEGRHGDRVSDVSSPSYVLALDSVVYVSEFWQNRVVALKPSSSGHGSTVRATVFAAGGGLDGPWGIAVEGDVLFVASFATDRVHRYNITDGRTLGLFGSDNELDCPEGIAIAPDGTVYVASFLSDTVASYTPDGRFLRTLSPTGLKGPEDIAVLPGGDLVVTSHYSDEILRVDPKGNTSHVFASVEAPVGVTVGLDGHVYTASYIKHAIVRFDGTTGRFIDYFATGGHLQGPSALSFASTRLLYVTSYENNRVILYNASARLSFMVLTKTFARE